MLDQVDIAIKMANLQTEIDILRSGCFTLGKLIENLEVCNQDSPIYISVSNHEEFIERYDNPDDYLDEIKIFGRSDYRKVNNYTGEFMSYRGYYEHLALTVGSSQSKVSDVLEEARNCIGKEFEGYKGGDFIMSEDNFVFCSDYSYADQLILSSIHESESYVDLIFKYSEDV